MTTEATPGPWEWDAGDIGEDYSVRYSDVYAGDVVIATNVREEDGPLIAAAPDLLEALKSIVGCVALTTSDDGSKGPEICQEDDFGDARAAIAKAEGRDEIAVRKESEDDDVAND